jgi:hypothetical protein
VYQNLLLRISLLSITTALLAIVLAIQYTYALSVSDDCGPAHVTITSLSRDIGMPGNFTVPIDGGMPGNFTVPIDGGMPGNFTVPIDDSILVNVMPTATGATIVNITSTGNESTCIILTTLTPQ